MKFHPIQLLLVLASSASLFADRITVHNRTPRDLYIAIYYIGTDFPFMEKPVATIATPIQFVEADSSINVERPPRKVIADGTMVGLGPFNRELVFVEDKNLLTPQLTKDQIYKVLHSKNVGNLQGDVFYIGDRDGVFEGFTTVEWNIVQATIIKAREAVIEKLPAIKENPYKNTGAKVRVGNQLPNEEKQYISERLARVKNCSEKLVNQSLDGKKIPKVALVFSGGGYRAMLYTTGALLGARNAGMLDCASYMVGLSGSTWAIGGWVLSGKPIDQYHDWLVRNIHYGLTNISTTDARLIGESLLTKYFFDEPFDIVDLYGPLVANELFAEKGELKQRMTLSSQMEKVKALQLPFPIYTAIAAESLASESKWYEFTPLEIGATWLGPQGMYVPSWAFGRKFKNGSSVNFAPEQNFGVLMGTFGLAIGITITRLIQEIGLKDKFQTIFVKNIIDRILLEAGEKRLTSSDFSNYTYQLSGSIYADNPKLKLVDAGIHINLPYSPLMGDRPERVVDIVIFVDASGDNLGNDLKLTAEFARKNGFKFPPIDYATVTKRVPTMFKDDTDPAVPIVIYVPRIVDQQLMREKRSQSEFKENILKIENFNVEECIKSGHCATFNFKNTEAQARAMTGLGMINMMAAKDLFAQAVALKAGVSLDAKQVAPVKPHMAPTPAAVSAAAAA